MPDKKKMAALTKEIEGLNDEITRMKNLCKDLAGNDNVMCSLEIRKKSGSGQHGIKDNVTRKQAREGMQKRIDLVKLDVAKKTKELAAASA